MKMIDAELERVRADIAKLKIEEALLLKMRDNINGVPEAPSPAARIRSPSVKPLVLEIMGDVGLKGATTQEVEALVKLKVPTVAAGTVGSVLARLKSLGALTYWGERYYEKQFAPKSRTESEPLSWN